MVRATLEGGGLYSLLSWTWTLTTATTACAGRRTRRSWSGPSRSVRLGCFGGLAQKRGSTKCFGRFPPVTECWSGQPMSEPGRRILVSTTWPKTSTTSVVINLTLECGYQSSNSHSRSHYRPKPILYYLVSTILLHPDCIVDSSCAFLSEVARLFWIIILFDLPIHSWFNDVRYLYT